MVRMGKYADSLASRMVLATLGFCLVFAVLAVTVNVWLAWQAGRTAMQDELGTIARVYERTLSKAVWELDHESIRVHLAGTLNVAGVGRVVLTLPHERQAADVQTLTKPGWRPSGEAPEARVTLRYAAFPGSPPQVLGELHLQGDERVLRQQLRGALAGIVATQLIQSLLLASFLLVLFDRTVTVHVQHIARHLASLGPRHLDRVLTLARRRGRDDELATLVSGINDLQRKLLAYHDASEAALQGVRQQLERHETLVSLGMLASGIAHEVSTPVAVIKAGGRNLLDGLDTFLTRLTGVLAELDPALHPVFRHWLVRCVQQGVPDSSRDERVRVRALEQALDAQGLAEARQLAIWLSPVLGPEDVPDGLPLLQHPQALQMAGVVHVLSGLVQGAAHVEVSADYVDKVVDGLRRAARHDEEEACAPADLRDGIERVLTLFQPVLREGIEVVRDLQPVPPVVCCAARLEQVWRNLLANAVQAMAGQGRLQIGLEARDGQAVVTVADSGCGMDAAVQARMFEPFFTTKAGEGGTGLGLDIVRRIVDAHGGHLDVESTPGAGTRIRVFIPLVRPAD